MKETLQQLYIRQNAEKALAQPEQEPVACIGYWNQKTGAYYKPDQISASHQKLIEDGILRRCYTTPPQRKPLTDEQIQDVMTKAVRAGEVSWVGYKEDELGRCTIPSLSPYHFQIVRAIEAAHGIKEKNTK